MTLDDRIQPLIDDLNGYFLLRINFSLTLGTPAGLQLVEQCGLNLKSIFAIRIDPFVGAATFQYPRLGIVL